MKKVAKIFRIQKFRTTVFYLQSNLQSQMNRWKDLHYALEEYLKQCANKQKQWDKWINLSMFDYNISVQTYSILVFGKIASEKKDSIK